jgi:hypothetical protein
MCERLRLLDRPVRLDDDIEIYAPGRDDNRGKQAARRG